MHPRLCECDLSLHSTQTMLPLDCAVLYMPIYGGCRVLDHEGGGVCLSNFPKEIAASLPFMVDVALVLFSHFYPD